MRNVSDKIVQKIKTHILCSVSLKKIVFFFRNNVEKYGTIRRDTDENMIMRMRFSSCITRATETQSECSNIITLLQQQRLHERASLLRYTYIAPCVKFKFTR